MNLKKVAIATALMISASGLSVSAQAADKKILLKTPIAFGSHLPALGTPIQWFADRIEQTSGGTIKMKIYEPGKLVNPPEILDAVSTGKVNAGYAISGYWQGKLPASAIFSSIPFGPEAPEFMAWLFFGNGLKLYQEMYDQGGFNVKVMPCAMNSPETSGWFRKPIEKPEDLKGLNMRFYGLGASVMEKLGVGTVQIPGGEIFGALEKGAIDASEFSQPAVDDRLGFHKVAKYNYFPGWHQQSTVFELLINKDTWNDMSATQQSAVETTCMAAMTYSIAEGEAMQYAAMEKAKQNGVEIRYWNQEMLDLFKNTWMEVVEEKKTEDPFFDKVWTDLNNFRKGYALWSANGFLPRETQNQ
jgi:TRAP-type mannitol/chloroaromatic compound transport system substrate-binding protein|nr:TRAP transporter substrate-binding protein [uncultured Vibrio sp.]